MLIIFEFYRLGESSDSPDHYLQWRGVSYGQKSDIPVRCSATPNWDTNNWEEFESSLKPE
jgi:hypothetical protein